ncbi:MAG: hypothetical protein JNL79_15190 [Myxococcales bacterium]|nr:hypothetical protein [Myxococcales bacterium]
MLLLLIVILIAVQGCGGAPGTGPAIGCEAPGSNAAAITPTVDCVYKAPDGKTYVVWGYNNSSASRVVIPAGVTNRMFPGPDGQGQPVSFAVGPHRGVFVNQALAWALGGGVGWAGLGASATCLVEGGALRIPGTSVLVSWRPNPDVDFATTIVPTEEGIWVEGGEGQGFYQTPGTLLSGSPAVTPDGASTYTIPLWTPPGRAGIEPALALKYHSRAGNGLVGIGWSLGGFSEVRRCAKSVASDGNAAAIQFSASDRLCLDGDYLVEVNRGSRSVEFRPEHDPYTRVVGYIDEVGAGANWSSFVATGRTGLSRTFAAVLNAKRVQIDYADTDELPPTDSYPTTVRVAWALSQVSDRAGNTMAYSYETGTADNAAFELRPHDITYTSSPQHPTPQRRVEFVYQSRADRQPRYMSGVGLIVPDRLASIRVFGPSPTAIGLVREYRLRYSPETATPPPPDKVSSSPSRLTEVRSCDGGGVCSEPLKFDWGINVPDHFERISLPFDPAQLHWAPDDPGLRKFAFATNYAMLVADVNGDGRDDVFYRRSVAKERCSAGPTVACDDPTRPCPVCDGDVDRLEWFYRLAQTGAEGRPTFGPEQPTGLPAQYSDAGSTIPVVRLVDIDADGIPEAFVPISGAKMTASEAGKAPGWQLFRRQSSGTFKADGPLDDALFLGPYDTCSMLNADAGTAFGTRCETWPAPLYFADLDGNGLLRPIRPAGKTVVSGAGVVADGPTFWISRALAEGALGPITTFSTARASYQFIRDVGYRQPFPAYTVRTDGITTSLLHPGPGSGRYRATSVAGFHRTSLPVSTNGAFFQEGIDPGQGDRLMFVDVNGDGLADAVKISNRGGIPSVAINKGTDFSAFEVTPTDIVSPLPPGSPLDPTVQLHGHAFPAHDQFVTDPGIRVVDWDHDGKQDLVLLGRNGPFYLTGPTDPIGPDQARVGPIVYRGAGRNLQLATTGVLVTGHPTITRIPQARRFFASGYAYAQVLDIDGDGNSDIIQFEGSDGLFLYHNLRGHDGDRLVRVSSPRGASVTFTYGAHTEIVRDGSCKFPTICATRALAVVTSQTIGNDGAFAGSATKRHYFKYQHPQTDSLGRGWLGFSKVLTCDPVSSARTIRTYGTSGDPSAATRIGTTYPFAGLMTDEETEIERLDSPSPNLCDLGFGALTTPAAVRIEQHARWSIVDGDPTLKQPFAVRQRELRSRVLQTGIEFQSASTTYEYGSFANIESATHAVGTEKLTSRFTYDNDTTRWLLGMLRSSTVTSVVDGFAARQVVAFENDLDGRPVRRVDNPDDGPALRLETRMFYDAEGQLTATSQTADGVSTRWEAYEYEPLEAIYIRRVTNAVGHSVQLDHHPSLGVLARLVGPNGETSTHQYDGFGRVRRVQRPDGGNVVVSHLYDPVGRLTTVAEHGGGGREVVAYDGLDRPLWTERAGFESGRIAHQDYEYDQRFLGLPKRITRPWFTDSPPGSVGVTDVFRDNLGRVMSAVDPVGRTVVHRYDRLLHESEVTVDGAPRVAFQQYDLAGRVVRSGHRGVRTVDSSSPHEVAGSFVYGPFGKLSAAVDAGGNESRWDYEPTTWLRIRRHQDPDLGVREYQYNAFGEVIASVDGNKVETRYERDALGRAWATLNGKDGATCFGWDTADHGLGQLATTQSPDGVKTESVFSVIGQPVEMKVSSGAGAFTLGAGYDAFGRLERLHYPASGFAVRFDYATTNGALWQVKEDVAGGTVFWKQQAEAADGQPTATHYGNGISTSYAYDSSGMLTGIDSLSGAATLQALQYSYNAAAELKQLTDSGRVERFGYDAMGRLETWTSPRLDKPVDASYAYDDVGNLRQRKLNGTATDYDVYPSGVGRILPHAVRSLTPGGPETFKYSAAGEQLEAPGRSVEYNGLHLPKRIQAASAGEVAFQYDAMGGRHAKQRGDQQTIYVGGLYERRSNGSGVEHALHILGPIGKIATVTIDGAGAKTVKYVHADRLGSPQVITDASGVEVPGSRRHFDPFGRAFDPDVPEASPTGPWSLSHGYTGHEEDDDLGLVNMQGRIYDPMLQRFLTPDPFLEAFGRGDGLNRYAYVRSSPTNLVDPTGFSGGPKTCPDGDPMPEGPYPPGGGPGCVEVTIPSGSGPGNGGSGGPGKGGAGSGSGSGGGASSSGGAGSSGGSPGGVPGGTGSAGGVVGGTGSGGGKAGSSGFVPQGNGTYKYQEAPGAPVPPAPKTDDQSSGNPLAAYGVNNWLELEMGIGKSYTEEDLARIEGKNAQMEEVAFLALSLLPAGGFARGTFAILRTGWAARIIGSGVALWTFSSTPNHMAPGTAEKLMIGMSIGGAGLLGPVGAAEETVSVFHGSIRNGGTILENGLDAARAPTFVSRDLAAAQNALTSHPDAVPGLGMIIESRVPVSQFQSVLAPLERPYAGFYPYGLRSTEITLRTPEHIQLFNQFMVKP